MTTFHIKQGDTAPALQATLRYADGTAINLTGATVRFLMRPHDDATVAVNGAATVITAADGLVEYRWAAGDTDDVGIYQAEFEIAQGSTIVTVPNAGYIVVQVLGDIG